MSNNELYVPNPDDVNHQTDPMLQFFQWKHLPLHLQGASKPFGAQAAHIVRTIPRGPERTASLRKLLEAKDCAVRAMMPSQTVLVTELE